MEDLTKHQLILLTLLVSFVTSIATGIITTSLLSQAPQTITRVINNVVERTVEKVVSPEGAAAVIIATTTGPTPATEDALRTSAISRAEKVLLRVWGTHTLDPASFISYGLVVTKDGFVITDKANVMEGGKYFAFWPDGTNQSLELIARNDADRVAIFHLVPRTNGSASVVKAPTYNTVPFAKVADLKLGQSLVALYGLDTTTIARGALTSFHRADLSGAATGGAGVGLISTDIPLNSPGFPVITLAGDIVGIHTYRGEEGDIVPLERILLTLPVLSSPSSPGATIKIDR